MQQIWLCLLHCASHWFYISPSTFYPSMLVALFILILYLLNFFKSFGIWRSLHNPDILYFCSLFPDFTSSTSCTAHPPQLPHLSFTPCPNFPYSWQYNSIIYIPVTPSPVTQGRKPRDHNSRSHWLLIHHWNGLMWSRHNWMRPISLNAAMRPISLRHKPAWTRRTVLIWLRQICSDWTRAGEETDEPASWKNPSPRLQA